MTVSAPSARPSLSERFAGLHRLIGNTPLVAVDFLYRGEPRVIYAKQESLNLTGSIKDRMALFIMEEAYRSGALTPGARIAEATSGNTGISFAAVGRALGHPVTIFMPDWMSAERMAIIASFGAEIVPVSAAQGGFLGSIRLSEELAAKDPNVFLPCQFANPANVEAHMRRLRQDRAPPAARTEGGHRRQRKHLGADGQDRPMGRIVVGRRSGRR